MGPRRVSIKVKLAGALAVPLIALMVVSGLEVARSLDHAQQVRRQTDLATAAIGPSGLITALQNERNFTGLWLLGADGLVDLPVSDLSEARSTTDDARDAFAAEIEDKGDQVARIYGPGLAALDQLDALRASVDAYDGPHIVTQFNEVANESFLGYTELVSALSDRNSEVITQVEDHELRRGVQLIDLSSREVDSIARFVRLSLLGAVTGDRRLADPAEITDASMMMTQALTIHYRTLDLARGPYEDAGRDLAVETEATGLLEMGPEMVHSGTVDIPAMLAAISLKPDESYYGFTHDVSGILQDRADDLNAAAQTRSRLYLAAAALVMAAAVIAIVFVSRSIVRPLNQLTQQSIAMAERHLPTAVRQVLDTPVGEDVDVPELAPIQVRTSDEVRDVAETLNVVQSAALELAVDQAMLRRNVADAFVNLARRNQNLISRQLDFITELERNETRTRTLDNLFRLDHHATRMRRNAESLLVLAGVEASRQWGEPVSLVDVVRAAVGEVEDYQRVTITTMDTAMVVGSVASDLAHLMAELIENALRFSPPELTVEVNGRIQPGHYLLLVIDEGMGMARDDLQAANDRLQHGTAFTVAPSRYLGHHVAGSLARRHGITVQMHDTPCSGITASVEIPTSLLAGSTLGTPDGAHAPALRPGTPAALPAAPAATPAVAAPAVPPASPRPVYAGGPIPVGPAAISMEPVRKPAIWPAARPARDDGGNNGGSWHPPAEVETVDLASRESNAKDDAGSAPPLTHRVPGAQPPQTEVHGLGRAPAGVVVAPNQPPDDMYHQLSQYADGLERGRHQHED
jgi:signal transduction histidine kinase